MVHWVMMTMHELVTRNNAGEKQVPGPSLQTNFEVQKTVRDAPFYSNIWRDKLAEKQQRVFACYYILWPIIYWN